VFGATGPISTKIGAGTLEFFNAAPGKVFLQLYANTGQSVAGALVAWQMESIAAVALPASIWLLLSALGSVGFWRWWSYRVWEFGTPAAT
jgi:hypothetical protein